MNIFTVVKYCCILHGRVFVMSNDSDQPACPPRLIRVFALRMKKAWVFIYPADLSRRYAQCHVIGFIMVRLK